tara:strand:+ start:783 stop:2402 length:1620 start_codon:yes stop_codon:yes gene_type:complete
MKNFKNFYTPLTLTSFFFVHIINLIKGNVFELDIHFIEKLSLVFNYTIFFIITFIIFNFLDNRKSSHSVNNIKITFYCIFFLFLFSSQIYGVYTLPVDLAPRSIIVLFIFVVFLSLSYVIKKAFKFTLVEVFDGIIKTISPISLIVIFNLLTIPIPDDNYSKESNVNTVESQTNKNPFLIFLFDMMPMDRFNNELDQDSLPNFDNFLKESTYFTNAYSPGSHTVTSVNSIFYGKLITEIDRTDLLELKYKTRNNKNWLSSSSSNSIFSDASERGFKTNIIAAANMSYSKWFGQYINSGYFFLIAPPINSFKSFILYPYIAIYNYLIPKFIKHRLKPRKVIRMEGIMKAIKPTLFNISQGYSDFLFVHFPIPHHDFVYDRDGNYDLKYSSLENDFTKQLYFSDTVFGELIEWLNEYNIYDKSTIMVISDHGWSHDPIHYQKNNNKTFFETSFDDETFLVKVPMILKLPNQKNELIVRDNYSLLGLRDLINNIIDDDYDTDKLLNYINFYSNENDSLYFTRHQYHDPDWELLKEKIITIKQ